MITGKLISDISIIVRTPAAIAFGDRDFCLPVLVEMDDFGPYVKQSIDVGNGTIFHGAWQKSYENGVAEVIFDYAQWEPSQKVVRIYCPTPEETRSLLQKNYKRQLTTNDDYSIY